MPATWSEEETRLRGALCRIGALCYQKGYIVGADGNLSARLADGSVLVTPAGAMKGFDKLKLQPVLNEEFDRAKPDFAPLVKKIIEAAPQAILFIGTNLAVAEGVKQIRAAGSRAASRSWVATITSTRLQVESTTASSIS